MQGLNMVYHKPSLDEDVRDETCMKYIGTVDVQNVSYRISDTGDVSFKVVTNEPFWLQKYRINYQVIRNFKKALILSTAKEIYAGDVFDIYSIVDPNLYGHLAYRYSSSRDACEDAIFYWYLKSRHFKEGKQALIDLTQGPRTCPICNEPLMYLQGNVAVCKNSTCDIHRYRDITRFLNWTCGIFGYNQVACQMVKEGILETPDQLYTSMPWDGVAALGYSCELVNNFRKAVMSTLGTVKLSEYLKCLPIQAGYVCLPTTPTIEFRGTDYLCPEQIDQDFQKDPEKYLNILSNMFDLYYLTDNFAMWKERVDWQLRRWMSIPVFFDMCNILLDPEPEFTSDVPTYGSIIMNLKHLGVFAK